MKNKWKLIKLFDKQQLIFGNERIESIFSVIIRDSCLLLSNNKNNMKTRNNRIQWKSLRSSVIMQENLSIKTTGQVIIRNITTIMSRVKNQFLLKK